MNKENELRIGDHIKVSQGFPFSSKFFNTDGIGMPLIRIRDLSDSKIETFYSGEYSNEFIIVEGDVLVSMDGDFKVSKWKSKRTALLNQRVMKISSQKGALIDSNFIFHFLTPFLKKIWDKTTATTVKHLSVYDVCNAFEIFPAIEEQRLVAKVLDSILSSIEKTQITIAKYQAIKQGMLHDLFTRGIDIKTGKLRPTYEEAPKLYKKSELGMIPKEWMIDSFSSKMEIINGGTPSTHNKGYWNGNIPWLSVDDFNNGQRYVNETTKKITIEGLKNSSTNLLQKGMIIISARGTVGVIAQLGNPMAFNQSCYGLNSIHKDLTNAFAYYFLLYYKEKFGFNSFGSVFSTITRDYFDLIKMAYPENKEETSKIVSRLSSVDEKLDTEKMYLQKLQQLKSGLMNDLLSGKKKVKLTD